MLGYGAASKFLRSEKEEERAIIWAIARGAREIQRNHDLERANQIAHQVMQGVFGK